MIAPLDARATISLGVTHELTGDHCVVALFVDSASRLFYFRWQILFDEFCVWLATEACPVNDDVVKVTPTQSGLWLPCCDADAH